jgi:hypothetical protein
MMLLCRAVLSVAIPASLLLARDAAKPLGDVPHRLDRSAPAGLRIADWNQIRAEHQRHRHTAFPVDGSFISRNREQQWRAHFNPGSFEIRPDSGTWTWGLTLVSISGRQASAPTSLSVNRNRVTYQRPNIEEWFLNDAHGLEQGFVIASPIATGRLEDILLEVRGGLLARGSGVNLEFVDPRTHTAAVRYSGLKAWDAAGRILPSRMHAENSGKAIRLTVDTRGARYPLTIDPVAQQAYLKPAAVGSAQSGDSFGSSVALSGDTLVVGAPGEDSSSTGVNSLPNELALDAGAAYVFIRSGGAWTQQAYLKPASVGDTQRGDFFGSAVSISGDTILVGAPGEDSASTGVNSTPNETAGDAGAAYVFVRSGATWSQQAYLKVASFGTSQSGDVLGLSVAVSGDTAIVGAPYESGSNTGVNSAPNESATLAGAAYVFVRSGSVWTQQAYLKPAAIGPTQEEDQFGYSVAIDGDTVAVGAFHESSSSTGVNSSPNESARFAGAAYVFTRSGLSWTQQAYLKPTTVGSQAGDSFGSSVGVFGDLIAVGAPLEDSSTAGVDTTPNELAPDRGAIYVFARGGSTWSQQAYLKASTAGSLGRFGGSVAIGSNAIVGGSESASGTGAAIVFVRNGAGVWAQNADLRNANSSDAAQAEDSFGKSVAISGDTIAAGAPGEDSSTTGIDTSPNENAANSGAAYVYTGAVNGPFPLQFLPIAPCRLVDTRAATGALGGPAIAAGGTRNFPVRSGCGLPASASAYSLNITVVPRATLGYLTLWPGGLTQPLTSTLNSLDGRVKANASLIPAGADGSVNVFATDLTDVIIDVNGVFVPQGSNASGQMFYPVTPCRISDSRAVGGGGMLTAGSTRAIAVANAAGCGIPSNATAYATNVTVVPQGSLGYLTLWPNDGSPQPTVSTLNALTGTVTANLAIVPAGSAGGIQAFVSGATDLILDVTGYFAPPGSANALYFYPLTPCRVADTRNANGSLGGPVLAAASTRDFPVTASACAAPSSAQAYSMNATVIPQPLLGYLTLFPSGTTRPVVSTLNAIDGSLTSNAAIVPAGSGGQVAAFVSELTHLLLDINGYFAP